MCEFGAGMACYEMGKCIQAVMNQGYTYISL
jgi:hypothetical protein